jgi:holo-[acyl-carrier protein] synthase
VIRVGCDLVNLERFGRVLDRNGPGFGGTLFSAEERAGAPSTEALARRFAVKEATLKALGTGLIGGIALLDVQVGLGDGEECRVALSGAVRALADSMGATVTARSWIEAGCALAVVKLHSKSRRASA